MATVAAAPGRADAEAFDGWSKALAKAFGLFLLSYLGATMAWILVPAMALGWKPLVVTSGSMAPAINRGDVVLIEPNVSPVPGHVVAYLGRGGIPVLHRLERVEENGTFITKGDANDEPDSTPVAEISGVGRLLVPLLGYVKLALPRSETLLVAFAGATLVLATRRRWALVIAGGIVGGAFVFVASASFASTTGNAGSGFLTATVSPPTNLVASCSSVSVGSSVPIALAWTGSSTPDATYDVYYDAAPPGGGFVWVGSTASTSFTHTVPSGQVSLGQAHTFRVEAAVGGWISSPTDDQITITQVLLVYVCT